MSIFPPTHPPGGPTQKARINVRKHFGPGLALIEKTAEEQGLTDPAQILGIAFGELMLLHSDRHGIMTEEQYKASLGSIWMLMGTLLEKQIKAD